jgi:hypothetical protein
MHEESLQLCKEFRESLTVSSGKVADVGSADVNGTYRDLFEGFDYTGFDIEPGEGVDVVLGSEKWDIDNSHLHSYDFVISGQVLEHTRRPWLWILDVASLCKPGGTVWICAPNEWRFHEYPIDCWRVFPDGMRALLEDANLSVIDCFSRKRDTVGIAVKR